MPPATEDAQDGHRALRIGGAIVTFGALALAAAILLLREDDTPSANVADPESASSQTAPTDVDGGGGAATHGLQPRPVDPAFAGTPSAAAQDRWNAMLDETEVLDGDSPPEAVPLRIALDNPVPAFEAEQDCRDKYGDLGTAKRCNYQLDAVVSVQGDVARVVAARAMPEQSGPDTTCDELAACLAEARVGTESPAGRAEPGDHAVASLVSVRDNAHRLRDPAKVREIVEKMQALRDGEMEARALADTSPDMDYKLQMFDHSLAYHRRLLERLESQ